MALTSFSIGRDTQVVVVGPNGRVDMTHVTAFESRQITHSVRVSRIDGTLLGAELPRGWEGGFEVDRGTPALDDFIASIEQKYFDNSSRAVSTMYQYVNEPDGSTSTYQYDNVVFKLTNAGSWKGDAAVKQKLEFFAARRRRI